MKKTEDKISKKNKQNENVKEVEEIKEIEESSMEISPEVIASIASIEIDKLDHVKRSGNILESIGGKKSKGIKVEFISEKSLKIDINIMVEYGKRIPDIAFIIQKNVKESVEEMTGMKAQEININVQGIYIKKEDE